MSIVLYGGFLGTLFIDADDTSKNAVHKYITINFGSLEVSKTSSEPLDPKFAIKFKVRRSL
jgi:hypothetical protein